MFLDEIGDTDLAIQPKLLKVVEEKRFRRLGEVVERRVDVRFLAATNCTLSQLVDEGRFREDLYYRINTLVLRLPPLRHRKADIPGLAVSLLEHLSREIGKPGATIDAEAIDALVAHTWPGNIRELRNVLECALLVGTEPIVRKGDLRLNSHGAPAPRRRRRRPIRSRISSGSTSARSSPTREETWRGRRPVFGFPGALFTRS